MENQQAPDMITERLSTCVSNEGPLHGLMKHPRQAPTPQDAAAGLTLLQQTLTSSHALYPVDSSTLALGDAAPVKQPYVSVWAPFSAVPPSLIQTQRKTLQRASKVLQRSDPPVENASIGRANIEYIIPPAIMHQEPGFEATVQTAVRPKTYPYMHGRHMEASPKPPCSLKRSRGGSKPAYPVFRQPDWHKQQRATQDVNLYPPVGGDTSSVWMSPPSSSLSFSDSTLEEMHTPNHQQDLLNQSLPSNFHSCAIIRNSLGSVIPSIDLLPCVPYIPPKCPETLTEAACMYIDYLIQENENLVHISYCEFLQPFTREKHQEFIAEATKGPCQMPSDKFRAWLKQFNVDVEVVTGEMQQSDDAEEDLEDFDASLFLPDIHTEHPSKGSPQQVANLAQFIPGLSKGSPQQVANLAQFIPGLSKGSPQQVANLAQFIPGLSKGSPQQVANLAQFIPGLSKGSPQQVANLAQFIPGLMSGKQPDGTVIIQCLPEDLTQSFAQHQTELITRPDSTDGDTNICSPVQQDVGGDSCQSPPRIDKLPKSLILPSVNESNVDQ